MRFPWTPCRKNSRSHEQGRCRRLTAVWPRGAGAPRNHAQNLFREKPGDEIAEYVTGLRRGEVTPKQVLLLYARRRDTKTVFDELKNQWGFRWLLQH